MNFSVSACVCIISLSQIVQACGFCREGEGRSLPQEAYICKKK